MTTDNAGLLPCRNWRKKPVVVEAIQFTGDNLIRMELFVDCGRYGDDDGHFYIQTLEGEMRVDLGDWVIKGVKGEFYPCKPDIFEITYEPASTPSQEAMRLALEALHTAKRFYAKKSNPPAPAYLLEAIAALESTLGKAAE